MEQINFEVEFDKERKLLRVLPDRNIKENLKIEKQELKKVKCRICFKIMNKLSLLIHMKIFHSNDPSLRFFHCDHCSLKYFNKKKLISHLNLKHQKGKEIKYECDFDGKIFLTRQDLLKHAINHQMKEKCEICGNKVKNLKAHKRVVHSKTDEKNFQCQICDKKFKLNEVLQKHVRTHNKQCQCKICGRKFANISELNEHMKYHDGQFRCKICYKNFTTKSNLKTHLKIHDHFREKQFKCQYCEFSTDNNHYLTKHVLTHDKNREKNLKCNQCDYITDQKEYLKRHVKIHDPNRVKLPCPYCNFEASSRETFRVHLKIHNPNRIKNSKCSYCKFATDKKSHLKRHITKVHKLEI
ncbi:hypothetical protein PVAND_017367 [Polypedilum vanderplanki]|uniref:C2H2-type domain-containing protein n=1 Tax=Polypedilum vanderplanki TaxID=319348 RepID=A0A9J6BIG9_POLVA|nr:hypothetical protein PVAND_017367 [Polypedilum vanderplanki]